MWHSGMVVPLFDLTSLLLSWPQSFFMDFIYFVWDLQYIVLLYVFYTILTLYVFYSIFIFNFLWCLSLEWMTNKVWFFISYVLSFWVLSFMFFDLNIFSWYGKNVLETISPQWITNDRVFVIQYCSTLWALQEGI